MNIVYMGTPEFAVPSLQILAENGYRPKAVITAPDKPKGRGRKIQRSEVGQAADALGIPLLQPTNLKDPAFQEELRALDIDLAIVVAFRMLPEAVWSMPKIGTFNLHGSLLPQYRGAAPIHWAVINGEEETGVTTFMLKHAIDTGDLLYQDTEKIGFEDTTGDVYERLMHKGAKLVLKTVQAIDTGSYQLRPQNTPSDLKHAPKLFREDCAIDFNQSVFNVYNFIRGLNPFPSAWTEIQGITYKIHKVRPVQGDKPDKAFQTDNKTYLHITCSDGYVDVMELQQQGKRKMAIDEFLRGYAFEL